MRWTVSPLSAMAIGAAGGLAAYAAVRAKHRFPFDDALDVVGIHLVAGLVGSLLVAVFASSSYGASADGLLSGSAGLVWPEVASTAVVAFVAFALRWGIDTGRDGAMSLRVTER